MPSARVQSPCLSDRIGAKTIDVRIESSNPFALLMRIPVPWVFQLVFLIGAGVQFLLPAALRPNATNEVRIGGIIVLAAGVLLAAWSLLIFRKERTTTVPGETSKALVVRGPYHFTRNPMYVSLTLAYLGEAGVIGQLGPVFLLPLVLAYINWIVIPVEESKLSEAFGAAYQDYRARVRRWI